MDRGRGRLENGSTAWEATSEEKRGRMDIILGPLDLVAGYWVNGLQVFGLMGYGFNVPVLMGMGAHKAFMRLYICDPSKATKANTERQMSAGARRIKTGLCRRRGPHNRPKTSRSPPPPPPREPIPFLDELKSPADPAVSLLVHSPPHTHTYPAISSLLHRLARAHLFTHVPTLLSLARSRRVPLRPPLLNSLIHHYGRAHLPGEALRLFRSLTSPSTQTLNFLLNALVDNGLLPKAQSLLSQTRIRPNVVSFNIVVKGVLKKDGLGAARKVLDEMPRRGIHPSVVTYNMLIGFAGKNGELRRARELKDEMVRKGVEPNAVTYGILMDGLCLDGRYDEAKKLMFDMEYQGCETEVRNYGVLMSDCGRRGDFEGMRELLAEMKRRKMKPDSVMYSILVNYLCDAGRVDEAYKVLVEMQMKGCEPSAAVYRMMVDGFCQAREFDKGLRVLNVMLSSGHYPRGESFRCLISGLCEGGKVDDACFVLEEMEKRKMTLDLEGWVALVEAFCGRCDGKIELLRVLTSIDFEDDGD